MITFTKKEMQQKIDIIKKNMQEINNKISMHEKPIFIELLGTPKSGKTTLLKSLKNFFSNNEMEIFTRRETAEYNPVEKESEQYELWMVLELFKNLSEDISNKQGKIVIYDRGIIDRLIWLEKAVQTGEISKEDFDKITGLYDLATIKKYRPITCGFLTSPELSIKRKGSAGRYVNQETLNLYNKILLKNHDKISDLSSSFHLVKTDDYQGKIEEFILDMTSEITEKITKQLEVKKKEKLKVGEER